MNYLLTTLIYLLNQFNNPYPIKYSQKIIINKSPS